eukprot:gene4190-7500_t
MLGQNNSNVVSIKIVQTDPFKKEKEDKVIVEEETSKETVENNEEVTKINSKEKTELEKTFENVAQNNIEKETKKEEEETPKKIEKKQTGPIELPNIKERITTDMEEKIFQFKKNLKEKIKKEGKLEEIENEIYQYFEKPNLLNVKDKSEEERSKIIYDKLKNEIFENICSNFQHQLKYIFKEEKVNFKKEVYEYLESQEYKLLDETEKIDEFNERLNEFLNSHQKEKRKRAPSKKSDQITNTEPKKKKIQVDLEEGDENFIVCGHSNSRGKPCMRRKGSCPYHSE